ncbi:polycystin-2-like [Lycorma delicatula]|uniref:polycystin-2-like n=1 Tax=Lycorma delicatula TaxID=130591 RepID=UPI003F51A494
MYYYTYVLRRLFTESKFHTVEGTEINMGGINSMEQVWGYLSQVVARCSDWHFWYSTDAKVAETDIEDRNVLFDNRIIGTPRVRQVRVTNHSCKVPDDFKVLFTRCYGFFSSSNEETGNIPVDSDAGDSAWVYHKASDLGSYSYSGIVATYSGGGFYKDLVQSSPTDRAAMTLLKNKLWISRATRAIFIDLATYNGNINVFCIVKRKNEFNLGQIKGQELSFKGQAISHRDSK